MIGSVYEATGIAGNRVGGIRNAVYSRAPKGRSPNQCGDVHDRRPRRLGDWRLRMRGDAYAEYRPYAEIRVRD